MKDDIGLYKDLNIISNLLYFPYTIIDGCFDEIFVLIFELFKVDRFLYEVWDIVNCEIIAKVYKLVLFTFQ